MASISNITDDDMEAEHDEESNKEHCEEMQAPKHNVDHDEAAPAANDMHRDEEEEEREQAENASDTESTSSVDSSSSQQLESAPVAQKQSENNESKLDLPPHVGLHSVSYKDEPTAALHAQANNYSDEDEDDDDDDDDDEPTPPPPRYASNPYLSADILMNAAEFTPERNRDFEQAHSAHKRVAFPLPPVPVPRHGEHIMNNNDDEHAQIAPTHSDNEHVAIHENHDDNNKEKEDQDKKNQQVLQTQHEQQEEEEENNDDIDDKQAASPPAAVEQHDNNNSNDEQHNALAEHVQELAQQEHVQTMHADEADKSSSSSSSNDDGGDDEVNDSDDNDIVNELEPAQRREIFSKIGKQSTLEDIKKEVEKYESINRLNQQKWNKEHDMKGGGGGGGGEEEDIDWNNFRNEQDDNILEFSVTHRHFELIEYLLSEKRVSPEVNGTHIMHALLDAIVTDLHANKLNEQCHKLILSTIIDTTLQPPFDRDYHERVAALKRLIQMLFEFKSECVMQIIASLLHNDGFVKNKKAGQHFDALMNVIKENRMRMNQQNDQEKELKKQVFSSLCKAFPEQKHLIFMRNDWNEWIFRDEEIFGTILRETRAIDEEYCRWQHDATIAKGDEMKHLVKLVMDCGVAQYGKANLGCTFLLCQYINNYADFYLHSSSSSSGAFDANKIMLQLIIENEEYNNKVKQTYLAIFYYFFNHIAVSSALSGDALIYQLLYAHGGGMGMHHHDESVEHEEKQLSQTQREQIIKTKCKSLSTIFVMLMVQCASMYDENNPNWMDNKSMQHFLSSQKRMKQFLKSIHFDPQQSSQSELKNIVERIINRCMVICRDMTRDYYAALHAKLLILFALKLAACAVNENNEQQCRPSKVLSHIFNNFEHDRIYSDLCSMQNEKERQDNLFALQRLRYFLFVTIPHFNTNGVIRDVVRNVHVLFILKPTDNVSMYNQEEDEEEKNIDIDGDLVLNMHLLNLSVIDSMSLKQIYQFICINFKIRYQDAKYPYSVYGINSEQGLPVHSIVFKLWNAKTSKWHAQQSNYTLAQQPLSNGDDDDDVLLITNARDLDAFDHLPLNSILSHFHRYALMNVTEQQNVFYFDHRDAFNKSNNMWLRGKISEVGMDQKLPQRMPTMITIQNTDQRDFGDSKVATKLFCDIFKHEVGKHNHDKYMNIVPSSLQHWLPLSYYDQFKDSRVSNKKRTAYCESWQRPQFPFISSFMLNPSASYLLVSGKVMYDTTKICDGRIEIISGFVPYPLRLFANVVSPKIELRQKLDLNNFVKQHHKHMNDDHHMKYMHDDQSKNELNFVWTRFAATKSEVGQQFHQFLVSDLDHVYTVALQQQECAMWFVTMQHIHKIYAHKQYYVDAYINMEFLRYSHDDSIETDVFVLTQFNSVSNYSSLLNDRFCAIYAGDINQLYPQRVVHQRSELKNIHPKHAKNASFSHSKQESKRKAKKKEQQQAKDYSFAYDVIKNWMRKNKHSLPKNTEAWTNVIKSAALHRELYPQFTNEQDTKKLALYASEIDLSDIFGEDDPPPSPPQKMEPHSSNNNNYMHTRPPQTESSSHHYNNQRENVPPHQQEKQHKFSNENHVRHQAPDHHDSNHNFGGSNHSMQHSYQPQNDQARNNLDAQSVKSARSMRSNQSKLALECCKFNLSRIPVIDISVANDQGFVMHDQTPHGCVLALPLKTVNTAQDVLNIYRTILNECTSNADFGLSRRIQSGYFMYANNYEELQKYHPAIESYTLFYYVRFGARVDNVQFKLLVNVGSDYSVKFDVHLYAKKPSLKKALSFRPFMARSLLNIKYNLQQPQYRNDDNESKHEDDKRRAEREHIHSLLPMGEKTAFSIPWHVSVECAANKQSRYKTNDKLCRRYNDANGHDLLFTMEANPNTYPKVFQRAVVRHHDGDNDEEDRKADYHELQHEAMANNDDHDQQNKPKVYQHENQQDALQDRPSEHNVSNFHPKPLVEENGNEPLQPKYRSTQVVNNEMNNSNVDMMHRDQVRADLNLNGHGSDARQKHNESDLNVNGHAHVKRDGHVENMNDVLMSAEAGNHEEAQMGEVNFKGNFQKKKEFEASIEFMQRLWEENQALIKENEMLKQRLKAYEK